MFSNKERLRIVTCEVLVHLLMCGIAVGLCYVLVRVDSAGQNSETLKTLQSFRINGCSDTYGKAYAQYALAGEHERAANALDSYCSDTTEVLSARAQHYYAAKDLARYIADESELANRNSLTASRYLRLAQTNLLLTLHSSKSERVKTVSVFKEALEAHPEDANILLGLLIAQLHAGELEAAKVTASHGAESTNYVEFRVYLSDLEVMTEDSSLPIWALEYLGGLDTSISSPRF